MLFFRLRQAGLLHLANHITKFSCKIKKGIKNCSCNFDFSLSFFGMKVTPVCHLDNPTWNCGEIIDMENISPVEIEKGGE